MTSRFRARLARFVVSFLAVAIPVGIFGMPAAHADDSSNPSPVNLAYAVNTTDGSSIFELAFQIVHISGDTVDPTNAAIAYSSCTNCKTVAVAIQIVIYDGSPTTFTPGNGAAAVNSSCNTCVTIADAYQFVFAGGPDVTLSKDAKKRLRELQKELKELGKQVDTLPPADLQARIDAIAQEVLKVVTNDLVARPTDDGQHGHADAEVTTSTTVNNQHPTNSSTTTTTGSPESTTTTALTTSTTA